jgi:cytochrome c oxidase assembly protein subunit 15
VALTVALFFLLRRTGAPEAVRKAVGVLFAAEMGQGLIGYVQYFTGVPAVLVGLHMLGSALMWIAVLRVVFAERVRAGAGAVEVVGARNQTVPTA